MRLSILIVTWNVREILAECLSSLDVEHLPSAWEIIVFDNDSRDGTAEMLMERFPGVRLLRSDRNRGYASGNNLAAAESLGRYLLFLNPDTLPTQSAITTLLRFMDTHPEIGVSSPQLLLPGGDPQPYAFGEDPSPRYLLRRAWTRLLLRRSLHEWRVTVPTIVDWVSGASMMVRREVWNETGGFDEHFFMYFEDNDLCLRARRAGWKIAYVPEASVVHLGGRSARKSQDALRNYRRSLRYFYRKHYGVWSRAFLYIALPFYSMLFQSAS